MDEFELSFLRKYFGRNSKMKRTKGVKTYLKVIIFDLLVI